MADLFDYPNHPGFKENSTSRDAAEAMGMRSGTLRDRVLRALQDCSGTSDEIARDLHESILAIRPRLSELRRLGLIEPNGDRRKNKSGMTAMVWRVTP